MTNITSRFSLDQVDHHELLDILTLRYQTCWRVSDREITFPAAHDYRLKLEMRHGQIIKITSGDSLSSAELQNLLEQVDADLKDDRIAEYGVDILFAHHPVQGGFRFGSLPMQILPAPPEAPRPPQLLAEHPFVLEYPMRAWRTTGLRLRRRRKNAIEWAWVLNALLRGSIKYSSSRPKHLWAIKSGDINSPCFWAQEFYIVPGYRGIATALSEPGPPLPVVPAAAYFSNTLSPSHAGVPLDTFSVPDNLDNLIGAFLRLNGERRRRFLRSAAAVYIAGDLWDVSMSSYFLACVQAIETLVDRGPFQPCPTCGKDTGPGPTRLFQNFVEKYCLATDVDKKVLSELYRVRSALAHGRYLFQLDEAPWAFNLAASVASFHEQDISRSAITAAKEGLRNWLLSESP
jgi:hypothetical protein